MEVEELDAIGKYKEENEDKAYMGRNNSSKEVIFKAQVRLQVIFHRHIALSRYLNWSGLVTHLRGHKAIDCPRDRRAPVIPPPPYWNLLHMSTIRILKFNFLLM